MLRISQTYAKIGIRTQNAQLNIRTVQPQVKISQEHAKVQIESELPRVHIDQYQCFAEAGLKNNMDLMRETTQLAYRHVMAYISQTAADGDRLAAVEKGGTPIADIAERNAYPEKEFIFDMIPKSRPKIEVTGDLKINSTPGSVTFDARRGQVDIQATRPEIEIYLRQKPSVRFQYIGRNVDTQI